MKALFTGSILGRVKACPSSAVLPQISNDNPEANLGNASHEHLSHRGVSLDYAMDKLADVASRWKLDEKQAAIMAAKMRRFEFVPPQGCLTELSLALFEDGRVEQIEGGRGNYDLPDGAYFAATLDVAWSEPTPLQPTKPRRGKLHWKVPDGSLLWVVDYKTGSQTHVHPVEHNDQIRACGLLAARFFNVEKVVLSLLFTEAGRGVWDTTEGYVGADELDAIEDELRDTYLRVLSAQRQFEAGDPPLHEGPHCTYCPAATFCPAKVAMVKAVLGPPSSAVVPVDFEGLQPAQLSRLAEVLPQIEAWSRKAKAALRSAVEASGQPIPLSDGNVWGPHDHESTVITPKVGVRVLTDELGSEAAAREALSVELSRASIERVVKDAKEKGLLEGPVAGTMRRIMAKIDEQGGMTKATEVWWSAHKPK